ncbi:MAG: type III-B CRISPR module-associated protein Cmr5 [Pseudomonadota bacterium]
MPTLDQERAAFAWEKVSDCDPRWMSEYTNLAKAAPALIMNNGLMQTLAYYQSKEKGQHLALSRNLFSWLGSGRNGAGGMLGLQNPDYDSIMKALYEMDSEKYRRATEESLALLRWIRQFASVRMR